MKKSTVFNIFIALLYREWLLMIRDMSGLICNFLFLGMSFFLLFFVLQDYLIHDITSVYSFMLITTVFTILSSDLFLIEDDNRSGFLEQLLLMPIAPEISIIAKLCVGLIKQLIVQIPFWFCLWTGLFGQEVSFFSIAIGANYLIFLMYILVSAFFMKSIGLSLHQHVNVMIPILFFVCTFPQLVFSILSIDNQYYILLSIALFIVMAPLLVILSIYAMKNASID